MAGASFKFGKLKSSVNKITASGGTTTLVNSSDFYQYVTGSTTQTIKLPDATTMPLSSGFAVSNASSGMVSIVDDGGNPIAGITSGLSMEFSVTDNATSNGSWMKLNGFPGTPFITATGGTITTDGNFKVHVFDISDTFQITSGSGDVQYLIVGAGGGGGGNPGGGGGAGGLLQGIVALGVGSYPVVVGAGGPGGFATASIGSNGGDSSFSGVNSTGGGGGSSANFGSSVPGNNGGSGGGSGYSNQTTHSSGIPGQGHDGGLAFSAAPNDPSGGGGGAGAVGADATSSNAGDGGIGLSVSITGSAIFYAGGGGGGAVFGSPGLGGLGGGGNGANGNGGAGGANGTPNTGGGGGGAAGNAGHGSLGGTGGSGVVVVRYQFI